MLLGNKLKYIASMGNKLKHMHSLGNKMNTLNNIKSLLMSKPKPTQQKSILER
jgi:hypothetical protein